MGTTETMEVMATTNLQEAKSRMLSRHALSVSDQAMLKRSANSHSLFKDSMQALLSQAGMANGEIIY